MPDYFVRTIPANVQFSVTVAVTNLVFSKTTAWCGYITIRIYLHSTYEMHILQRKHFRLRLQCIGQDECSFAKIYKVNMAATLRHLLKLLIDL